MIEPKKPFIMDIDGTNIISDILRNLLNEFPGLNGREILFSTLSKDSGISFFPDSGAVIETEKKDILGNVIQLCSYPFTLVYRSAPKNEDQKLKIKEFLDTIGKWLERAPVKIGGTEHKLTEYPELEGSSRKIDSIRRASPGYLSGVTQDGVEDWVIQITLTYKNQFTTL